MTPAKLSTGNMERLNLKGRTFVKGCPLSSDFRTLIIDEIVRNGGDIHSGYFPGQFSDIAKVFKVSKQTVKNVWLRLHMDGIEEETLPT